MFKHQLEKQKTHSVSFHVSVWDKCNWSIFGYIFSVAGICKKGGSLQMNFSIGGVAAVLGLSHGF